MIATRALAFGLGLACFLACSFTSDSELEDGKCPAGTKACDRKCVRASDPNFGCGGLACAPCSFPNARATCAEDGACKMGACLASMLDCDGRPENGCEINGAIDGRNCGTCNTACGFPNAIAGCRNRVCTIAQCVEGFADCNRIIGDGCEVDTTRDNANCGACTKPCGAPMTCDAGTCQ